MKKIFFIAPLAIVIIVIALLSFKKADKSEGIQFYESTWQEVLDKAKAENKPIFLDISASWCGPCKMLKKKTFTNKEVADYFNSTFINASFDGEVGDGIMLANKFQLQGYPTLIILNPKGEVINGTMGYYPPNELLKFGKESITRSALKPKH